MIPWYRQAIALVFGLGVMLIALWAIEQGSGALLIGSIAGMAFLTLLLIFGVEVDTIEVDTSGFSIDFSNTTVTKSKVTRSDDKHSRDDRE
jgi:hypothetical protein